MDLLSVIGGAVAVTAALRFVIHELKTMSQDFDRKETPHVDSRDPGDR